MEKFLNKLNNKQNLTFEESKEAFEILMNGKASDQEIYDFLTLLSAKEEVADEIGCEVVLVSHGHINHQRLLKTNVLVVENLENLKNILEEE